MLAHPSPLGSTPEQTGLASRHICLPPQAPFPVRSILWRCCPRRPGPLPEGSGRGLGDSISSPTKAISYSSAGSGRPPGLSRVCGRGAAAGGGAAGGHRRLRLNGLLIPAVGQLCVSGRADERCGGPGPGRGGGCTPALPGLRRSAGPALPARSMRRAFIPPAAYSFLDEPAPQRLAGTVTPPWATASWAARYPSAGLSPRLGTSALPPDPAQSALFRSSAADRAGPDAAGADRSQLRPQGPPT